MQLSLILRKQPSVVSLCCGKTLLCTNEAIKVKLKVDLHINLELVVKLKNNLTDCLEILKEMFGYDTTLHSHVYVWYKRISEGREEIAEYDSPGVLVTAKPEKKIRKL